MSRAGEMGEEYRVIRELKFDVQGSKFRKLRTSDREPSPVSLRYPVRCSVLASEIEGNERSGSQPNFP
mgnify:FL=1